MARQRDYKKEYQRRISRNLALGRSRAQARGHARPREKALSKRGKLPKQDARMARVIAQMLRGTSLSKAAHRSNVAPERVRKFIAETKIAKRKGKRWHVSKRRLLWEVPLYTRGRLEILSMTDPDVVGHAMDFMDTTKLFVETQDTSLLKRYAGKGVRDRTGQFHPFELDPNRLYRLRSVVVDTPEKLYRVRFR